MVVVGIAVFGNRASMDIKDTDVVKIDIEQYSFGNSFPKVSLGKNGTITGITNYIQDSKLATAVFSEGIEGAILRPGSDWVKGRFYCRLEFIADTDIPSQPSAPEQ
jgi:hypothetical protein